MNFDQTPSLLREKAVNGRRILSRSHAVALVGLLCSTALLAACGGSSSTTDAGASNSTAAHTVDQSFLDKYSAKPTSLLATDPLKSTPPRDKTFVYMQCALPQCKDIAANLQEATSAIGWNYKVIAFDSTNPATLVSGMKQALQYNPVATALGGLPQALWASVIPDYQKANAIIIPIDIGSNKPSETVPMNVAADVGPLDGKLVGEQFIKESGGSGKALIVSVPDFPIVKEISDGIQSTVSTNCAGCSTTALNATIAQQSSNAITPAVVSALQRDPKIKYVLTANGHLIPGLPAALSAAGITGVKIMGAAASAENLQDVKNGTETAFVQENLNYNGLLALDAALRHVEGMPILPNGGGTPVQLLTKANLPSNLTESLQAPADALQQFERLWKVG